MLLDSDTKRTANSNISIESQAAAALTTKLFEKIYLRQRLVALLEVAVHRTSTIAGHWQRYLKRRSEVLLSATLAHWYILVVTEPRRAHSPTRVLELRKTADSYAGLEFRIATETLVTVRRSLRNWLGQIRVLSDVHKIYLVSLIPASTDFPLTVELWWRIRAFLWHELHNPVLKQVSRRRRTWQAVGWR